MQLTRKIQARKTIRTVLRLNDVSDRLKQLKAHHPDSYRHSVRTAIKAVEIGLELGYTQEELEILAISGQLHDMGKIRVPAYILDKKTEPTPQEREIIETHPRYSLIELLEIHIPIVKETSVQHHEWQNDSYPRRRKVDRRNPNRDSNSENPDRRTDNKIITDFSQIIAVGDHFDALTKNRSYRKGLPLEIVKKIMYQQMTVNPNYLEIALN
jgi:HD-GYP domain-containing protein (c-di-GMP phosphodiesterase class II)